MENVKAIILAAGKGTRMKSNRAKVLHEILGAPMLAYVLKTARDAGIRDLYTVVGYQVAEVKKAVNAENITWVEQNEQKGTGDAVRRCAPYLKNHNGDLLVLGGDTPLISTETLERLLHEHKESKAAATVLTACMDDPRGYGRICRDAQGKIARIVEEANTTEKEREISEINSGIYAFRASSLFPALGKLKPDNRKGEYYLTDVIRLLLQQGETVACARALEPAEAYGVNSRKDLVAVSNYLRLKILEEKMDGGVTIVDPSTTFIETNVEIGQDTLIHPFTVIRHDVKIGCHCEIGPFAHLRPDTVIEDHARVGDFVEIKKTRLGMHSKTLHLSYLGDALVGKNVNIGAGTITANYDGKQKHQTIIEDGAFTGCNTVLIAPVTMGKNSKTGAGAIVPRGHDIADGDIVTGVPAKSLKKKK